VLTGSRPAELELAFSAAQEAAMFGRSALALAAPVQGRFFRDHYWCRPTLKVAGGRFAFSHLPFGVGVAFAAGCFLFWVGLVHCGGVTAWQPRRATSDFPQVAASARSEPGIAT